MKDCFIVRDVGKAELGAIVTEAFERFLDRAEATGAVFILKPNLGFKIGSKGGTTSVELIEAALGAIQEMYGATGVYVVESDGIAFSCEEVFGYLGLYELCERYAAQPINLSKEPCVTVRMPDRPILTEMRIPRLLLDENTILVNLPKIKTHEISRFSCAIKNLWGLNPYVFKLQYHPVIDGALCDLYRIFKPHVNIVDAMWAIDGRGPWTGTAVHLGMILASRDALVTDLASLRIIGWKAEDVPYLSRLAATVPTEIVDRIQSNVPTLRTFSWQPLPTAGLVKEKTARAMIPLLRRGMPLLYYSRGSFRLVSYGNRGGHCQSIKSFPARAQ